MKFEDFQHLARLYVVGALDWEELRQFDEGLRFYGEVGEEYVQECRRLEAAFALSLRPAPPKADAKARLLSMIQKTSGRY